MFDLNRSLSDWRHELLRSGAYLQNDIAELEGHLREEMAGLAEAGLCGEEAFLVATRRLGKTADLNAEYAKVHASRVWMARSHWMAFGILTYLVAAAAAGALQRVVMTGTALVSPNSYFVYIVSVLSPLISIAIMALIAVSAMMVIARRATRSRGAHPRGLAANGVLLVGVVLWCTLLPMGGWWAVVLLCRHVSPDDLGRMSMATSIGQFAFSALLPLAMAGWILRTRPLRC